MINHSSLTHPHMYIFTLATSNILPFISPGCFYSVHLSHLSFLYCEGVLEEDIVEPAGIQPSTDHHFHQKYCTSSNYIYSLPIISSIYLGYNEQAFFPLSVFIHRLWLAPWISHAFKFSNEITGWFQSGYLLVIYFISTLPFSQKCYILHLSLQQACEVD